MIHDVIILDFLLLPVKGAVHEKVQPKFPVALLPTKMVLIGCIAHFSSGAEVVFQSV